MINNNLTYVSLFSSAGVGCYGFKQEDYLCIATNELIERRLNIQKINNKCMFDTGYINGDITKDETKNLIFKEIKDWHNHGNDSVDVVIATPPCQGMSVANHKKNENDLNRNSLVVESIKIIKNIEPKFFIFENVPAFLKTACTSPNGDLKEIKDVILEELGSNYTFHGEVINFKNYGSNSSRTRTVVIGVHKKYADYISPIELFPNYQSEKTLREVIGNMPQLSYGEILKDDFYHQARIYPKHMEEWISPLKEGQSAFDNEDPLCRPHQIKEGILIPNVNKNGDKYTRQYWDKVAPCIHTRNDQLASQSTIHPQDNRVFSIRELMKLMTIPDDFKWINMSLQELNSLTLDEKLKILKKEEMNIRQSIGEAVPTSIFRQIAHNIKSFLSKTIITDKEINQLIKQDELFKTNNLLTFLENTNLCNACASRLVELANPNRENNAAFFTSKILLNEIYKNLPDINKDEINIIEPSVGIGNFLPYIIKKYENKKKVIIDIFDIDENILNALKVLLNKWNIPRNIFINFYNKDSLLQNSKQYDLYIGNPPFSKVQNSKKYSSYFDTTYSNNLFAYFMENGLKISDYVILITPKNILNTPEFTILREKLSNKKIDCIIDCGEYGFKGVLIETVCTFIDTKGKFNKTKIISLPQQLYIEQKQSYIFDKNLPYWIIYRNEEFDKVFNKLEFNIFSVFRDRQITNSNTSLIKKENSIKVIKSRNITIDGEIIDIDNYTAYIDENLAKKISVYQYLDNDTVYLVPNMTYNPRMCKKGKGYLVNGSVAILTLKSPQNTLSEKDIKYFASNEFKNFYRIARNYQTRSLNIDATSVFWFGRQK